MTTERLNLMDEAARMLKRAMDHLEKTDRLYSSSSLASPYDILNERYWDLVDFVESKTSRRQIN